MSVELVYREDTERRCLRIAADALVLSQRPMLEVRANYDRIERARDALSRLLDHADGKDA
jgi:hypothetical protein